MKGIIIIAIGAIAILVGILFLKIYKTEKSEEKWKLPKEKGLYFQTEFMLIVGWGIIIIGSFMLILQSLAMFVGYS